VQTRASAPVAGAHPGPAAAQRNTEAAPEKQRRLQFGPLVVDNALREAWLATMASN
jgi:hypothetical protein